MRYVILAADGSILSDMGGPQPDLPSVVEVPDADPRLAAFDAGEAPWQVALEKRRLKLAVDDAAEARRLTLITPGSGQAMEYQEAYAEAVQVANALQANPQATFDPAAFPMLAASIGSGLDPKDGQVTTDVAGEARSVLAAYDAYQRAGAAIRSVRLKGKAAIDAADTAAAARAAFAAIAWPALG